MGQDLGSFPLPTQPKHASNTLFIGYDGKAGMAFVEQKPLGSLACAYVFLGP